ncbi:MAG: helix-turn-helix transcriptional regulator [Pirellulaceae bacterium]|nr:helix-turn-helix transcriptional regulator [Pirellulaceae bacterium]
MKNQRVDDRVRGLCVCGNRVRDLRILRGMTQTELAKLAGYSERLVRKAEAGGSLSQTTIEDLADALSCQHSKVTPSDLCSSPETLARTFVDCYDEHERRMLDYCGHLLDEDFVFHCAAAPGSSLGGDWCGAEGFQAWLDQFFSITSRLNRKCLKPLYMTAENRVTARYCDTFVAADHSQHVMWVNLHFTTGDGLIQRIDDEYDTSLAAKLESGRRNSSKPHHPR